MSSIDRLSGGESSYITTGTAITPCTWDIRRQFWESQADAWHRKQAEAWVDNLPKPSEMVDPSSQPPPTEPAFATPSAGFQEVENILYSDGDRPVVFHEWLHWNRFSPLALFERFDKEVQRLAHQLADKTEFRTWLGAGDMIKRRWEQVFSSRMPDTGYTGFEKPVLMCGGKPVPPCTMHPMRTYEERFMEEFLPNLKLIGNREHHPSQAIRLPRALADDHYWQDYARERAKRYEDLLGQRNSWIPFLLTRPFVLFELMCVKEDIVRGLSTAMVAETWKQNGWWIGGKWSEDSDGPGWTWPGEEPSYFLDDSYVTWDMSDQLWLGDPEGPTARLESPAPRSITSEQLNQDPTLSQRQPHWVAEQRRREVADARQAKRGSSLDWVTEHYSKPEPITDPMLDETLNGTLPYDLNTIVAPRGPRKPRGKRGKQQIKQGGIRKPSRSGGKGHPIVSPSISAPSRSSPNCYSPPPKRNCPSGNQVHQANDQTVAGKPGSIATLASGGEEPVCLPRRSARLAARPA